MDSERDEKKTSLVHGMKKFFYLDCAIDALDKLVDLVCDEVDALFYLNTVRSCINSHKQFSLEQQNFSASAIQNKTMD